MMLKVKRTHVQDGCTVAFGATVMGGSLIERDTTILPLSLVLKEMTLPTSVYEGSPAGPVSGANLRHPSLRADEAGEYFRVAETAAE
jgi:carbonic anhydrase/acetyltransferase-like protein (isoleucine patch superfamily)